MTIGFRAGLSQKGHARIRLLSGPIRQLAKNHDEKLKVVNLALQSGSCPALLGSLTSTYGPEQSKSNTSALQMATWWDQKHANRVNYAVIGSHCYVQYSPLSSPGQPGGL
jgi:hypothetical protein